MARGDSLFARFDADWHMHAKCLELKTASAKWLHAVCWMRAVSGRNEAVCMHDAYTVLTSWSGLDARTCRKALQKCIEVGLISINSSGMLVVVGVRDKHRKLKGWAGDDVPHKSPQRNLKDMREEKRREEKRREDTNPCAEAAEPPSTPPVLILPVVGNGPKEFPVTQDMIDEWQESYPGVDVLSELRKARQWCIDSPARKKTYRGARKFLGGWLSRSQNSGASQHNTANHKPDETARESDQKLLATRKAQLMDRLKHAREFGNDSEIDNIFADAKRQGVDLGMDF